MPHSLTLYVLTVVFIATLIRSTFGFGEALVAVPLLALRMPILVAAPLGQAISVLIAGAVIAQDWRHVRLRSAAGLTSFALLGIPLGLLLLVKANEHVVKLILGLLIISFSIYSLSRKHIHGNHKHWGWMVGCGFLSGIFGGAYGMGGPPLVIYGALRGWSPQHFRATLQGYFLLASFVGVLGYIAMGLWNATVTHYLLFSLPLVAIGVLLGRTINARMKGTGFFRAVYASLILIGGILILQSIGR